VHGRVPGSELVILGLGRLGGMELTHASDLDLVYLFTGTHEAESDGRKPLRATDYFNRLAPRVTAALSVPTASGPLYDVDTRLRPSGQDGLLAVSLPSYADYLRERAWTWEHMALTRARPVYGSPAAREQLQQVIDSILRIERDPATLTEHAVHMRGEMAAHKPAGGKFDIKLGSGGLVDLEFAVQVAAAGLVEPATVEAQRLLTRMLVTLRLVSPSSEEPPAASRELVARACRMEDWNGLLAAHDEARQRIGRLWDVVAASKEG
jgi:glutamate-ammonia-ligase adenylyltransferase